MDRTSDMINVLGRNYSASIHCPMMKDQWDCVLNDLEELKGKEFLVLTGQKSVETFSCCLRLLLFYSSTVHQTNAESCQIRTEDTPSISRIQSLHHLLEVIFRVEEECLIFLPLGKLDRSEFLVQYQSMFFPK